MFGAPQPHNRLKEEIKKDFIFIKGIIRAEHATKSFSNNSYMLTHVQNLQNVNADGV